MKSIKLHNTHQNTRDKRVALTKLAHWYDAIEKTDFDVFNSVIKTIQQHYLSILNYFDNRSTNSSADFFIKILKSMLLEVNLEE